MAEIFLSPIIEALIEKLLSELIFFARREGVDTSVKKWEQNLGMIRDVLADAEEKQITKPGVRKWLQDLQELAFDAEDVLEELATEAKRRMLKAEAEASNCSKIVTTIIHVNGKCSPLMFLRTEWQEVFRSTQTRWFALGLLHDSCGLTQAVQTQLVVAFY